MQLIHLTYRWPSNDGPTEQRIQDAHKSWITGSDPTVYKAIHLKPADVDFTSEIIGDTHPRPILKRIITQAFSQRENDMAMLLFVNTDIGLIAEQWPTIERFIKFQDTHYEHAEHTRPRRRGEATSTPVTFFFSYRWWQENAIYIPPILFACRPWEYPLQRVINRTTEPTERPIKTTYHVPHPFWKAFENWRTPERNYNAALSKGWKLLRLDHPSFGRGLRWK